MVLFSDGITNEVGKFHIWKMKATESNGTVLYRPHGPVSLRWLDGNWETGGSPSALYFYERVKKWAIAPPGQGEIESRQVIPVVSGANAWNSETGPEIIDEEFYHGALRYQFGDPPSPSLFTYEYLPVRTDFAEYTINGQRKAICAFAATEIDEQYGIWVFERTPEVTWQRIEQSAMPVISPGSGFVHSVSCGYIRFEDNHRPFVIYSFTDGPAGEIGGRDELWVKIYDGFQWKSTVIDINNSEVPLKRDLQGQENVMQLGCWARGGASNSSLLDIVYVDYNPVLYQSEPYRIIRHWIFADEQRYIHDVQNSFEEVYISPNPLLMPEVIFNLYGWHPYMGSFIAPSVAFWEHNNQIWKLKHKRRTSELGWGSTNEALLVGPSINGVLYPPRFLRLPLGQNEEFPLVSPTVSQRLDAQFKLNKSRMGTILDIIQPKITYSTDLFPLNGHAPTSVRLGIGDVETGEWDTD